jgi:CheY-like chemotaxis protein
MHKEKVIIIADDDMGHCLLMTRNFRRAGITNEIISFTDGQELLDFLMARADGPVLDPETPYLLLLDIRMPRVDGIETLRLIKAHEQLRKLPVIMVSTTDDPRQVHECYELGCSFYLAKPTEQAEFTEALEKLGRFISLSAMKVPEIEVAPPRTASRR